MKLLYMRTTTFTCWNFLYFYYLNARCSCSMSCSHITIYNNQIHVKLTTVLYLQHCVTAPATVKSRYSRYMLCVPLRESYRNQIPIFLINVGLFSDTLTDNIRWALKRIVTYNSTMNYLAVCFLDLA